MSTFAAPHRVRRSLLSGASLATLIACAACGAPGTEDVSQSSAAVSPSANDQAAFDFFIGKGLTAIQAAGIVGNLDQESQVDPTAVQAGGPGRGIAQWSVGGRWDTDTNDNVLAYASAQGESSSSLTLQLEFIWYELTTFSGYGLSELQAATNVTDSTVAFETYYEGCGECDQSTRIAYAQDALNAYGSFDYGAAYVSQSFPLASSALQMTAGQTIASYIELRNTGTKSWDSNTRIGTSQPRDRVSVFADSTWVASNRPAEVSGTVAPGATYKFTFDLHAPTAPGTYYEYFGVVEEGVAWFSDPGQGGPPDDDLEVQIVVTAGPTPPPASDPDAGAGNANDDDAGAPPTPPSPGADDDAGSTGGGVVTGSTGVPAPVFADDAGANGSGGAAAGSSPASGSSGCTVSRARGGSADFGWILGAGALVGGLGARRRSRRTR